MTEAAGSGGWWRAQIIGLVLAAFLFHIIGLQRTLPLMIDVDEDVFVYAALRIASSGDLAPGFYGTPGATTIYPLAAGARIWHAITQHGRLLGLDPNFTTHSQTVYWEYFYLGRFLSVAYAVASVVLTVVLGRRVFGSVRVGVMAGWFYLLAPTAIYHARMVRTDSAATFYGLLALYLCLRLLEHPSARAQVMAGASIGLAIASRYFMAGVGIVLLGVDLLLWQRAARAGSKAALGAMALGIAMIPIAFLLANPAMLVHSGDVIQGLRAETVTTHLGADGLSPLGNMLWYGTNGLPVAMGWAMVIAAVVGAVLVLRRRDLPTVLMLTSAAALLIAVSLSPRHFGRYIIQIVPVVALLAAYALECGFVGLRSHPGRMCATARPLYIVALVALVAYPLYTTTLLVIRESNANTRIIAREWIQAHLAPESRIGQEAYGAFLEGTGFVDEPIGSLPQAFADGPPADASLKALRAAGYDYVVASSAIYNRYFAEPERYVDEIAFYNQLFTTGPLVHEIDPAWNQSGPVIRIYAP